MKMREKDISLCVCCLVLVYSLPTGLCSEWMPIAPPKNYYATKTVDCDSDCDRSHKNSFLRETDGAKGAETQVKSTLLSPSVAFNQDKGIRQSNGKLDLDVLKPTEVSFFPSGEGKTYQEVKRHYPTSFFSYKTYGGPGKPAKTIYYGDLELAKPKFPSDVKYYKPYKHSLRGSLKTLNPAHYFDNEVNLYQSTREGLSHDHCSLYKVSLRQDLYYQYIQYKVHMPELTEFTLCLWARFHNHSHEHSLFSYSAKHHRQAIYMWVSNLNEPGLFNMKVLDQTIYRLNYPIKLYKWYHTCQSWNGNTGEWQVWVDSHRIARGFHNLLVNHPIPGGGTAISGQEHRHFGRGFQEIPQYFKGAGGLQGEITMLQMYKIALTAGKAYNDHSHHHSHYTTTTTEPPELPTDEPSTTTDHPLLENGQLKKHVNILELAEALKKGQLDTPEHLHSYQHFFNTPLSHSYVSHVAPLAVHGNTINFVGFPSHAIFKRNDESKAEGTQSNARSDDHSPEAQNKSFERVKVISNVSDLVQVGKVKFPKSEAGKPIVVLPRQQEATKTNLTAETSAETASELSGEVPAEESKRVGKRLRRQSVVRMDGSRSKRITFEESRPPRFFGVKKRAGFGKNTLRKTPGAEWKRHVIFEEPYLGSTGFGPVGLTGHDSFSSYGGIPSTGFSYDFLPHFGQEFADLGGGGEKAPEDEDVGDPHVNSDDSGKETTKEVELAEGEVRRIMELCSGCHLDPFRKVAVISWRSTPKKMYSGTLFLKAKSECGNF